MECLIVNLIGLSHEKRAVRKDRTRPNEVILNVYIKVSLSTKLLGPYIIISLAARRQTHATLACVWVAATALRTESSTASTTGHDQRVIAALRQYGTVPA